MKPNLIIPLMGKRRKKLFSLKNFFFNNKYSYLINHICSNFTFCNKIIIICRKQDKKYIKFRNISKLKFIYLYITSEENIIYLYLKSREY